MVSKMSFSAVQSLKTPSLKVGIVGGKEMYVREEHSRKA
jgi:hypothetical protein